MPPKLSGSSPPAPGAAGTAEAGDADAREAEGVVLVVDDDEPFAETVRLWLDGEWIVRVATDGDDAVEAYGPHVDVVLLDRRMPTMSGDETLREIRDRPGECCVAMITAVDPDLDVAEMPFDSYLQKPVSREELSEAVDRLYKRTQYDDLLRSAAAIDAKLATLESRYAEEELTDDERYRRLEAELARLAEQAEEVGAAGGPVASDPFDRERDLG